VSEVEQFRADVLGILHGLDMPLQALIILASFSFGLYSVRAIA